MLLVILVLQVRLAAMVPQVFQDDPVPQVKASRLPMLSSLAEALEAQPADQVLQVNLALQVPQDMQAVLVFPVSAVALVPTDDQETTVQLVITTGAEPAPRVHQAVTTKLPSVPVNSTIKSISILMVVIEVMLAGLVKPVVPVSLAAMARTVQPAELVVQVDKVLQALLVEQVAAATQDERARLLEAWDQEVSQVLTVFQVEVASKVLQVLEATTVPTADPVEWVPTVYQAVQDEKVLVVRAVDQVITDGKEVEALELVQWAFQVSAVNAVDQVNLTQADTVKRVPLVVLVLRAFLVMLVEPVLQVLRVTTVLQATDIQAVKVQ